MICRRNFFLSIGGENCFPEFRQTGQFHFFLSKTGHSFLVNLKFGFSVKFGTVTGLELGLLRSWWAFSYILFQLIRQSRSFWRKKKWHSRSLVGWHLLTKKKLGWHLVLWLSLCCWPKKKLSLCYFLFYITRNPIFLVNHRVICIY